MKRILGIIGSPRKLGNCEVFTKEISAQVPIEHELRLLRLQDFNLRDCTGCYRCLYEGKCVIDDDLPAIQDAMMEADAYILAVPAYFLGANASLKRLLDRGLSFYGIKERLWGKPSIAVAVAGIDGKEGTTLLSINGFLKAILSEIKASVAVYAALPGEILFSDEGRATARRLGAALFGEAVRASGPRCPLCGGDSFRIIGDREARCLLCGNDGSFSIESGSAVFDIRRGGHELHLDAAGALRHEAWLRRMKDRLVAELPRIRKAREDYRGGEWIRPARPDPPPGYAILP
jgi:NAD(P)H-dependent FMN reductase